MPEEEEEEESWIMCGTRKMNCVACVWKLGVFLFVAFIISKV
jgi:hypothetical protein